MTRLALPFFAFVLVLGSMSPIAVALHEHALKTAWDFVLATSASVLVATFVPVAWLARDTLRPWQERSSKVLGVRMRAQA